MAKRMVLVVGCLVIGLLVTTGATVGYAAGEGGDFATGNYFNAYAATMVGLGVPMPTDPALIWQTVAANDAIDHVKLAGIEQKIDALQAQIGALQTQLDNLTDLLEDLPGGLVKIDRNKDGN